MHFDCGAGMMRASLAFARGLTGGIFAILSMLVCTAVRAGTVYFQEPSISHIDHNFFVDPPLAPLGLFELIQWPPNPNSASGDFPVEWGVGQYTGYNPPSPPDRHQRGVSNLTTGSTAVQAAGNTVGFLIDSASLATPSTSPGTLFPIVAQYNFPEGSQFAPFAEPGKTLVYAMQAQIPYADAEGGCGLPGSACAYATLYFDVEDVTTGLDFWYGATLYDTRGTPNGLGYLGESVMYDGDTQQAIIGGVVNLSAAEGAMFTTALPTSSGFQSQTWTGDKAFQFAITRSNFLNAIRAVKSTFPQQYANLSDDPANYLVFHFNFNPEVAYFGGKSSIGVSFNNIRISVQDSSDCYDTYNGVSNVVGLTNGDSRFLCYEKRWHECAYSHDAGWFTHASNGEVVGSYTCDLGKAAWKPRSYNYVPPTVGSQRTYTRTITDNFGNALTNTYTDTVETVDADGSYVLQQGSSGAPITVDGSSYGVPAETINVNNQNQEMSYWEVEAGGDSQTCTYDPRGPGPNYPLTAGDAWTVRFTLTCGTGTPVSHVQTGTIGDVQSVTVPAGAFNALQVQSTNSYTVADGETLTDTTTDWLDVATMVLIKESVTRVVSGTTPTNGYEVGAEVVLESRDPL